MGGDAGGAKLRVLTAAEGPGLELAETVSPECQLHGDVVNVYWGSLSERFPDFQLVLVEGDDVVARRWRRSLTTVELELAGVGDDDPCRRGWILAG